MFPIAILFYYFSAIVFTKCYGQNIYVSDINYRIEPGAQTCVFETGKAGQMMEVYYQVLDGQHGDLDISFEVIGPNNVQLVKDFKSAENSIIMDLEESEDNKNTASDVEAEVAEVDTEGAEQKEVLQWEGIDENGQVYHLEVAPLADSLSLTLRHVVKSRRLLGIYAATKSRDSYTAFEDTFIVDVWSSFQISLMFAVGMIQVYMIKKLFTKTDHGYKSIY